MAKNSEGKMESKLTIKHSVQVELDRLEALIKEQKKTWIVIAWKYSYSQVWSTARCQYIDPSPDATPSSKVAKKLYCIDTGEIKEI